MKVMESHGKAICFWKIKRQEDKKIERIKDKSKQALISVEIKTSMYFMHYNTGKHVIKLLFSYYCQNKCLNVGHEKLGKVMEF